MNKKKIFLYSGATLAFLVGASVAFYGYAYVTLKQQAEKQGEIHGFKLFIDGIVIDEFKPDPAVKMTQVYLHGFPWQLMEKKPEYISVTKTDIDADKILDQKINWPFKIQSIDMPSVKISKTILGKVVTFTGFAKQSSETPLLLDFSSDDEKIGLSGKAEIRIDKDKIQMIDVDFEQADIDALQFGTKRGTGWLSFSYEDNWQIVGELDAGITLLGQYQFFDSSIKITGAVAQPEMTFAGRMNDENIVIDQREGNYFIRRNEQTLPVTVNNQPLQETILTLDKINQIQLAEAQALKEQQEKQAEEEQKKKTKDKKKLEIKPAEEPKPELAPPVAFKIEPVKLPEIKFAEITGNTALAGFIYPEPLVQVNQPCLSNITGQCWTAHGQGGQFSYNPAILPDYFLKLKDYEQVKQLKVALLNLNVQSITIQGKDKTAQKVILKGSTPDGQPVEVQLSVLGLE